MLCVRPWAVDLPPAATSLFLLTTGATLVLVGILLVHFYRHTLNQARQRTHTYSWQLQQLLARDERPTRSSHIASTISRAPVSLT